MISSPTRISANSESLLDLFFTNGSGVLQSGVIAAEIGDHSPEYLLCKVNHTSWKSRRSEAFFIQAIDQKALDKFRTKIGKINFISVLDRTDACKAYNAFMHVFVSVYKNCFQYKKIKRSKKIRKPWLTKECLRMIREKNLLYAKFVKTQEPADLSSFKKYQNFLNKFSIIPRNSHFEKVFHRAGIRSDVIWREVNKILLPNCPRQQELELTIGNKVVGGEELANTFDKHFMSLNSSMHDINATSFLGNPNRHTAFFEPATTKEVHKRFMSLKNSTSHNINGLQIRLMKYVLDLVVDVLTHIFNICLFNCVFPEKMQHAKVIVLFKSSNTNELANYRPVSVLPIISKGLEKGHT